MMPMPGGIPEPLGGVLFWGSLALFAGGIYGSFTKSRSKRIRILLTIGSVIVVFVAAFVSWAFYVLNWGIDAL